MIIEEMMIEDICHELNLKLEKNVSLADYTTFHIGGSADYLISPRSVKELKLLLDSLKERNIPYFVIGKGSNILVRDGGVRGAVIRLYEGFNYIERYNCKVKAGAGVALPRLSSQMLKEELKGLEFAWGIPGTVGGALIMNAGAFGSCIGELVQEVLVITSGGELKKLRKEDITFNYRNSSLKDEGHIVLEGILALMPGEVDSIRRKMMELKKKRSCCQPAQPSAGSIFRNPPQAAAGKLIEDAGLKGFILGGAAISEVHANFIVNKGGARASEVLELIRITKLKVKELFGIDLRMEIEVIGEN